MTSFTGSTAVGKRVAEIATGTVKRLHLELGGKAPFLVFDDADLEAAAHGAVAGALINTGQDCTAATRAYVQRPLYDAFVAGVAELMAAVRRRRPVRARPPTSGPLISHAQRDRVAGFVDRARVRTPPSSPAARRRAASWPRARTTCPPSSPTPPQDSEIVQQEIFGPVLVVLPFDSDDEGIAPGQRHPVRPGRLRLEPATSSAPAAPSREIQAGCVWINDHIPIISEMPHGGYKASGFGKDMSAYSFEEYTQVKHVMYDNTGVARKDWHRTVFGGR